MICCTAGAEDLTTPPEFGRSNTSGFFFFFTQLSAKIRRSNQSDRQELIRRRQTQACQAWPQLTLTCTCWGCADARRKHRGLSPHTSVAGEASAGPLSRRTETGLFIYSALSSFRTCSKTTENLRSAEQDRLIPVNLPFQTLNWLHTH